MDYLHFFILINGLLLISGIFYVNFLIFLGQQQLDFAILVDVNSNAQAPYTGSFKPNRK